MRRTHAVLPALLALLAAPARAQGTPGGGAPELRGSWLNDWAMGLPLATFVAYSRIAAQKHYLTDVVCGALSGAAAGFLVPWLHRMTRAEVGGVRLSLALSTGGLSTGGEFP